MEPKIGNQRDKGIGIGGVTLGVGLGILLAPVLLFIVFIVGCFLVGLCQGLVNP